MSEDINDLLFLAASEDKPVAAVAEKPKNGRANLKSKVSYLPDIQRLLPQSTDAELGVLASFVLAPKEVAIMCIEKGLTAESFHQSGNALMYQAMMDLWSAGKGIDIVTLTQTLRNRDQLDAVGGPVVPTQLMSFLPTAANASYYIDIVQEKKALRDAIVVLTEKAARCYDEQEDVPALLSEIHADITKLVLKKDAATKSIRILSLEVVDRINARREGRVLQLSTGIQKLDSESPVRIGDFVVIAGRRKSGKSTLAANIIRHACAREQRDVAAFSLEMPAWQWVEKLIADVGQISLRRIGNGQLDDGEVERLHPAVNDVAAWPLHLFDNVFDIEGIIARLRHLKAKRPAMCMAVVDYCQLVKLAKLPKGMNREQEVATVSRSLRLAAMELEIAVIGLSQLNTNGSTRESTSLEQDCTALWNVIEELDDKFQPIRGKEHCRTLWVPFQRNGGANVRIHMTLKGEYARLTEDVEDHPELPMEDSKPKYESKPSKRFKKFHGD